MRTPSSRSPRSSAKRPARWWARAAWRLSTGTRASAGRGSSPRSRTWIAARRSLAPARSRPARVVVSAAARTRSAAWSASTSGASTSRSRASASGVDPARAGALGGAGQGAEARLLAAHEVRLAEEPRRTIGSGEHRERIEAERLERLDDAGDVPGAPGECGSSAVRARGPAANRVRRRARGGRGRHRRTGARWAPRRRPRRGTRRPRAPSIPEGGGWHRTDASARRRGCP